ncbi:MAG: SMC family ATPase [Anaerolineales bacterium]|nr:SMC family ATPase [Anaerolineales bacterium]
MIPLHLHIAGFLSYYDPIELDFSSFDLACISGHNGAGKSSLLDAMTWALFGEARGKSADVINLNQNVKAAEVALTFEYEGNLFRVQRTLPRGKSTTLEFQILDDGQRTTGEERSLVVRPQSSWRPLTEKSTSATQARIEQTLRMDYETFINASFFLQGKADQFTQKKASERKTILSAILGLEIWDEYKARAAEKRKLIESDVQEIDGRVAEIDLELGEEDARKTRLAELEKSLAQLSSARAAQETTLENIRKNATLIGEQKKLVETLSASLERSRAALANLQSRLSEKESERETYADLASRAKEIESARELWQTTRKELETLEKTASQFREHDERRQPLLREIEVEKAKLEQEFATLSNQLSEISGQLLVVSDLQLQIEAAQKSLLDVEAKIQERGELETQRNELREKFAALRVSNEALKKEMDEIKKRIDALEETHGAACPVCGQELTESHRQFTLDELNKDGKVKGDQFRDNKKSMEESQKQIASYELRIAELSSLDNERVKYSSAISQLTERVESFQSDEKEWNKTGKKRLAEITKELEKETFAADARKQLAKLNKELAKLGYDAAAHDAKRKEEIELRGAEEEYQKLDKAREIIKQIESEIANLKLEIGNRESEVKNGEADYRLAQENLEATGAAPDLNKVEDALSALREDENDARAQVGAARQKVDALTTLRARKKEYANQREELNQQIMRHKTLERAFGKDGVPALLIEQALPQIENKANDLLERLSDGQMSIRFVTQAEYKDKKRGDLKETLDIQISDGGGARAYEMYSGGEAFRINFAIRLALSEILAQRKGARLQTLVIDEGFGSQDAQGRQRLIEAINLVRNDFAKILVITHLDELKDAFPNRIEVEKTERGSTVKVY